MKVIDLLNKIANGEKVPKWVVYDEKEYTYMEEYKDYVHTVYNNGTMLFLLSKIFNKNGIDIVLNQELDFIEEEKEIPEKIRWHEENGVGEEDDAFYVDVNGKSQYVDSEYDSWEMTTILKINEIIDYLKSKGE